MTIHKRLNKKSQLKQIQYNEPALKILLVIADAQHARIQKILSEGVQLLTTIFFLMRG